MEAKRQTTELAPVRVAVIGAGPVGLEAALALSSGSPLIRVTVIESGEVAGAAIRARWGHVPLFSPWKLNQSAAARKVVPGLDQDACPTGLEFCEQHLDPLRLHLETSCGVAFHFNTTVVSVSRESTLKATLGAAKRKASPFAIFCAGTADPDDERYLGGFDVVLDCSGSTSDRAFCGKSGAPAIGERKLAKDPTALFRYIPTVGQFGKGQRVAVIGSGYSAATSVRNLQASGCEVLWLTRRPVIEYAVIERDPLTQRTALCESANAFSGTHVGNVQLVCMARAPGAVTGTPVSKPGITLTFEPVDKAAQISWRPASPTEPCNTATVDAVVSNVGLRPDASVHSELQVHLCYASDGPMRLAASLLGASGDCLQQAVPGPEVLTSPEPNFFVLGMKSYGRSSAFLLRVGAEQVSAVAGLVQADLLG